MAITRLSSVDSRVDSLAEEMYEHFLREAGEYNNPEELYAIATAVADRFKDQIEQSRRRNLDDLGSLGRSSRSQGRADQRKIDSK